MAKLFVANWKAYVESEKEAAKLARTSDANGVVVCPPLPFLHIARRMLKKAALGSQDLFWEKEGPFTGEVSPEVLRKIGVKYAIIGHSERRKIFGESDNMINEKMRAAIAEKIMPILCVGEPREVRKKGLPAALRFVERQLDADLRGIKTESIIVAYEPIWAIGTGKPDNPADSAKTAEFIKLFTTEFGIHSRVLYGGSVTSKNIARILSYNDIDGVLVGGASVNVDEIKKIIGTISHYHARNASR